MHRTLCNCFFPFCFRYHKSPPLSSTGGHNKIAFSDLLFIFRWPCWPRPTEYEKRVPNAFEKPEAKCNLNRHKWNVTDLTLFVVLHRWGLMALSPHRSRCTSSMKSNCSATRTSPALSPGPQVQHAATDNHTFILRRYSQSSSCSDCSTFFSLGQFNHSQSLVFL